MLIMTDSTKLPRKEALSGVIVKSISDEYTVDANGVQTVCKARGVFRHNGTTPLVGDRVRFELSTDGTGRIIEINDRKNFLLRPPVANIDRLFIVSSADMPRPNRALIDRTAVFAHENDIEPCFIFNKTDLADVTELVDVYKKAGYAVYTVSCKTGQGTNELKNAVSDGINAFTGNSGVGKSSILNLLIPENEIKTGDISLKLGRGRHTTRHTQMYGLCNSAAYVIDTPGFSSESESDVSFVYKENLQFDFLEFEQFIGKCRFTSCSHTGEKDCAVKNAVDSGLIDEIRYKNYVAFYREAASVADWRKKR